VNEQQSDIKYENSSMEIPKTWVIRNGTFGQLYVFHMVHGCPLVEWNFTWPRCNLESIQGVCVSTIK